LGTSRQLSTDDESIGGILAPRLIVPKAAKRLLVPIMDHEPTSAVSCRAPYEDDLVMLMNAVTLLKRNVASIIKSRWPKPPFDSSRGRGTALASPRNCDTEQESDEETGKRRLAGNRADGGERRTWLSCILHRGVQPIDRCAQRA
jgi:hypothetical protein